MFTNKIIPIFTALSFFACSVASADTFTTGSWGSASYSLKVAPYKINYQGGITLQWSSGALSWNDGFNVYHRNPSNKWQKMPHQSSQSISFADLEPGKHHFAIECICWNDEYAEEPERIYSRIEVEVPSATGKLIPDYKIVSMIYAPPGTKGGNSSRVTYEEESTLGTSTPIIESFSRSASITLNGEVDSKIFLISTKAKLAAIVAPA